MKPKKSQHSSIPLSPSQLLEISQEISGTFNQQISSNISELVILPVDPFHLYAYWHLDDQQMNDTKTDLNQQLALKVYWQNDKNSQQDPSKLCFNVNLDATQSHQKIRLPVDATNYSATLGTLEENQCWNILARSNTIHIPAASMQPKIHNRQTINNNAEQPIIVNKDQTPATVTTTPVYDEALIDTKTKQTVLQQFRQNNPERLLASGAISVELETAILSENDYDESQIDALIQQALHEKNLNATSPNKTLANTVFSFESHFAASNFSGQNLLF